jgi:hypothetical protein
MFETQSQVPLPVVAAITAALAVVLERSPESFVVKSIEPVGPAPAPAPSLWPKVGLMEAHLTRASFGRRMR